MTHDSSSHTVDPKVLTCVRCPFGCVLKVTFDQDGSIADVTGNTCERGLEYAQQEAVNPERSISAVVMARGALEPLSVKTARPIPKDKIFQVMDQIRTLDLQVPIQAGETVIEDAAGTGVSVVATKSLP